MDLGLQGLRALVSGGTRGIGRAIAETLDAEGTHVAICARQDAKVDETATALRRHGVPAADGRLTCAMPPPCRRG